MVTSDEIDCSGSWTVPNFGGSGGQGQRSRSHVTKDRSRGLAEASVPVLMSTVFLVYYEYSVDKNFCETSSDSATFSLKHMPPVPPAAGGGSVRNFSGGLPTVYHFRNTL